MNERIRELVRQAVIAVDNPFPGNPLNDELEKMYIPDCFAEKFAELIVRECAALARKKSEFLMQQSSLYADDDDEEVSARATAWQFKVFEQEIKRHFGVEE